MDFPAHTRRHCPCTGWSVHLWQLVLLNKHIYGSSKVTVLEKFWGLKSIAQMVVYLNYTVALYGKYWLHIAQTCISQHQCISQVCLVLFQSHSVLHYTVHAALTYFYFTASNMLNLEGDFRWPCTWHRNEGPQACLVHLLLQPVSWPHLEVTVIAAARPGPCRTEPCHPISRLHSVSWGNFTSKTPTSPILVQVIRWPMSVL